MQRHPMTPLGRKKLEEQLRHLKEVVRPQIVRDIEEARAHGDISENSEFEDAKDRQAHCEGRIIELTSKVAAAEVIDVTKVEKSDRVIFGATVSVEDLDTEVESTYRIVGEDEADLDNGTISVTSPIARALVGREVGEETAFDSPRGRRRLYISEVEYI